MIILGIETSCDETSVGIVRDGNELLACVTASSMDIHAQYGGVVPELAAREHIQAMTPTIEKALAEAFPRSNEKRAKSKEVQNPGAHSSLPSAHQYDPWDKIDAIAVTCGAGLGGSLLVGVMTARTLAIVKNKPLYAVNHVEGHIYANFLTKTPLSGYKLPHKQPSFPMLGLIVSGGHSQLVLWQDHFDYTLLGQTRDDAIGEAFDKVAKILGLPYPGGPSIAKVAAKGNATAYRFPKARITTASPKLEAIRAEKKEQRVKELLLITHRSLLNSATLPNYDYSFSGVKTAVLRTAQKAIGETHEFPSFELATRLSEQQKADIAASFQHIAVETVVDKTIQAVEEFQPRSVVIGGGVAASAELRRQLAERLPFPAEYTDPKLCTDNGAMIAALGCFHMQKGQPTADPYTLDIQPNLSM